MSSSVSPWRSETTQRRRKQQHRQLDDDRPIVTADGSEREVGPSEDDDRSTSTSSATLIDNTMSTTAATVVAISPSNSSSSTSPQDDLPSLSSLPPAVTNAAAVGSTTTTPRHLVRRQLDRTTTPMLEMIETATNGTTFNFNQLESSSQAAAVAASPTTTSTDIEYHDDDDDNVFFLDNGDDDDDSDDMMDVSIDNDDDQCHDDDDGNDYGLDVGSRTTTIGYRHHAAQVATTASYGHSLSSSSSNTTMMKLLPPSPQAVDGVLSSDDSSDDEPRWRKKHSRNSWKGKELDVDKYMASREMTPLQERMNAVTVMPGAFYCIMLLLSGSWLSQSEIEEGGTDSVVGGIGNGGGSVDDSQCLSWSWMPHLHAMPPLPVLAAAIGIIFHAPFSFIYHWKYAHRLPPGLPRTTHWSRRMDQAMIHFCSMTMAYATSGRWDFFIANALFNIDCMYRQFKKRVRPRRNQIRIFISVVAYTIPIVRRGDLSLFVKIWALFSVSGWLFAKYPIGGWSHSAFHIVMAFVPPLLMEAGLELPASQPQLRVAAQCAMMAQSSLAAGVNVA